MEILGLLSVPTWLICIIAILSVYLIYMTWSIDYFKKRNIPHPTPYPVFGNLAGMFKVGAIKNQNDTYRQFKHHGVYGQLEGTLPAFFISKPEYIKEVTVKKFNDFTNRRVIKGLSDPKPLHKMLTVLKDDHWKYVRNTLTPTFSGRKLRRMVSLINEAADSLMKSLDQKVKNDEDIEIKERLGAFTMDVISSTAFGLKVDAQNDPDNPFITSAKKFFKISLSSVVVLVFFFFPFFIRLFGLLNRGKTKEMSAVFIDATKENIKVRKENTTEKYVDSLQLMLDTQKEVDTIDDEDDEEKEEAEGTENVDMQKTSSTFTRKTGLTDEEILSQAVLFFIAGYETTANTLTFTLYNLAVNPECYEKLAKEVDDVLKNKNPTYDDINKLTYLEMCISETLRLTPIAHRLERVASRDTEIGGVVIPEDAVVAIPISSIQVDEEYWPDPEKFDPERFTPENKAKRDPYVYMPFGVGPRNCIGMRLALLEAKIALARIVQDYKPMKCEKTKVPLNLPKIGNRAPPDGVWIKLAPRH